MKGSGGRKNRGTSGRLPANWGCSRVLKRFSSAPQAGKGRAAGPRKHPAVSPRALFAPAVVLLAASLPACGGEGGPRAKKTDGLGPADASTAVDQCLILPTLQFQPI